MPIHEPEDPNIDPPRTQPIRAFRAARERPSIQIYNPSDLRRIIHELEGRVPLDEDGFIGPTDEIPWVARDAASLSSEDANRLRALQRISKNRLGPRRFLLEGTAGMVPRVIKLRDSAPHVGPFFDLLIRAIHVSMTTATPLRPPPVLLVGPPGIGKTHALKHVAEAIEGSCHLIAMNNTDHFRLRGLNTAWRGARTGKLAEALLASPTASPLIILDELEKMPQLNVADRPFDIFHTLFEEENSSSFQDDYLEFPMRLDHVLWIASANRVDGIPHSILDRMLILELPAPTTDQLARIVERIYAVVRERYAEKVDAGLAIEVVDILMRHSPRRLKLVLSLAVAYALSDRRHRLSPEDVERAAHLAGSASAPGVRHPIGFMRRRG